MGNYLFLSHTLYTHYHTCTCTHTQPAECDGEYEMIVSVGGPVSVVTIDKTHGFILVAVENVFK